LRSTVLTVGLVAVQLLGAALPARATSPYRVRKGDSLWTVARKHNTSVETLCRLNGLKPDVALQIGQRLQVPGSSTTTASSSSSSVSGYRYIGEPFVNVRKGAGTDTARVALATRGTPCRVLGVKDPWVNVKFDNGTTGWIRRDLLRTGSSAPASASRSTRTGSKEKGYIAGTVVNVRSGPGTNHSRVTQARRGATVWILGRSSGWMEVKFGNGTAGWVAQELIKLGQKIGYAYVKNKVLNLRSGPATKYEKVGQLTKGQRLTVYKRQGDWLRVQCSSGQFGWVADWLVKEKAIVTRGQARVSNPSRSTRSGGGSSGSVGAASGSIVATALKYRGTRYRFGSASPRRGFDCSGFVYYVLSRHGIHVPRSSGEQYQRGAGVSQSSLRPGDLVFFKNTYRSGISHVGFYMGGGKFIHASSSGGVKISELSHPYYRARYAGARRL